MMRLQPGFDILTTLYAVYHLIRSAKDRTPGSSASYHFFALIIDCGLIPFYVFAAIMACNNFKQAPGTEWRWRSFFTPDDTTTKIFFWTWIVAMSAGGLHLLSGFLSVYLVIIFRKIARLPPDMNPLEDNLTSRHPTRIRHKAKNSTVSMSASEKHLSSSTMASSEQSRLSYAKRDSLALDSRPVSFFQTRNNADDSFSPHSPSTAKESRGTYPDSVDYQQRSARNSQIDLGHRDLQVAQYPRKPFVETHSPSPSRPMPNRASVLSNLAERQQHASSSSQSFVSAISGPQPQETSYGNETDVQPRPVSPITTSSDGNWQVHDDRDDRDGNASDSDSDRDGSTIHTPSRFGKARPFSHTQFPRTYHPLSPSGAADDDDYDDHDHDHDAEEEDGRMTAADPYTDINLNEDSHTDKPTPSYASHHSYLHPTPQPLRMHPPTPPSAAATRSTTTTTAAMPSQTPLRTTTPLQKTLSTLSSTPSKRTGSRNYSFTPEKPSAEAEADDDDDDEYEYDDVGVGSRINTPPKRRHYGSLRTATAAIKGIRTTASKTAREGIREEREKEKEVAVEGSPRVVSRSGVDVDDGGGGGGRSGAGLFGGGRTGGARRREVSGKVAEEGRAMRRVGVV